MTGVVPGSPADRAGLREPTSRGQALGVVFPEDGDVIVAINGQKVAGSEDIARIVTSLSPGQAVPFKIVREGRTLTLPVRLGERSETNN